MKDPAIVRQLVEESIPLHKLLEETGTSLAQVSRPEQMSCPFHGADTSKSARYYPETNSMYCFACKKSWTPVYYWMQYQETNFMQAAESLARKYGIDLSKVSEIKKHRISELSKKRKGKVDKKKMAMYLLEDRMRLAKDVEEAGTYAKMLYIFLSARHIEDQDEFVKVTKPLAKRLKASLG